MPRPRLISDDALREAARACFLEHGPAVSVTVVAERLGVTAAAGFRRVGDKDALLRLALDPGAPPDILTALRDGPRPDEPLEAQLAQVLGALLSFFRRVVPGLLVMRATGAPSSVTGAKPDWARAGLTAWIRAAGKPGAPETLADLLVSAVEARCLREHLSAEAATPRQDAAWARRLVRAMRPALGITESKETS